MLNDKAPDGSFREPENRKGHQTVTLDKEKPRRGEV